VDRDDITRIGIGSHAVGIVGLKQILEDMAKDYADKPREEVQAELLNRLSERNYIPAGSKEAYGESFFREFNKYLGKPYAEEGSQGLEIKILGAGCSRCNTVERMAMEVVEEMGLAASVEHVTDIKEIGRYGVMGTPAVVINGKVMSVGLIPQKDQMKQWLAQQR
jgi:small redox-active disulfide protein 2